MQWTSVVNLSTSDDTERGKMNKQNTLTREQIQSLFVNYLNTLSDKELTKLVKRVKPELIENITLSVS